MLVACLALVSGGCKKHVRNIRLGVSIAVLSTARWEKDAAFMKQRADELGVSIETIVSNVTAEQQFEDCKKLIQSGIDVLILTPANAKEASNIVKYAHSKRVKVISYDRIALYEPVDLVITFDSYKVGELQGKYLSETVDSGNYVVLSGDENDFNASMFLEGAMKYIEPLAKSGAINIVMKSSIPKWSPTEANTLIKKALADNNNNIDAILAPNDTTAAGCIEALKEVELDGKVAITGMDSDLAAVKRVVAGKQSITVFKDMRVLAKTAVEQAVKLARGEDVDNNSVLNTLGKTPVITVFVEPHLVIKQNLNKTLIDSGFYTREQVYD